MEQFASKNCVTSVNNALRGDFVISLTQTFTLVASLIDNVKNRNLLLYTSPCSSPIILLRTSSTDETSPLSA